MCGRVRSDIVNITVGLSVNFYQRYCQKHHCAVVHVTLYRSFQIWRRYIGSDNEDKPVQILLQFCVATVHHSPIS